MALLTARAFIADLRVRRLLDLGVFDPDILTNEVRGWYETCESTLTWLQCCPVPYWLTGRATIKSVFTLLKPHAPRPTSKYVPWVGNVQYLGDEEESTSRHTMPLYDVRFFIAASLTGIDITGTKSTLSVANIYMVKRKAKERVEFEILRVKQM